MIALVEEGQNRDGDAGDRREDQQQQADRDDRFAARLQCALEDLRQGVREDGAGLREFRQFRGGGQEVRMVNEDQHQPDEHHRQARDDADAQHPTDDDFHPHHAPVLWRGGRRGRVRAVGRHDSPFSPLRSICTETMSSTDDEDVPDQGVVQPAHDTRADHRADEDPGRDGPGDERVDVAAREIQPRAGGGGDADHEIARRGGDLDRQAHGQVHRRYLQHARADAQQPAHHAGDVHQPQPQACADGAIVDFLVERAVVVTAPQAQVIRPGRAFVVVRRGAAALAHHHHGRAGHHDAENHEQPVPRDPAGQVAAGQRAERRGDLEHHRHPQVRHPLAHVRRRRAARGRDDRDDARADGVPDVHLQRQRQRRDHNQPAAQPQQRADESPGDRNEEADEDEFERCHRAMALCPE